MLGMVDKNPWSEHDRNIVIVDDNFICLTMTYMGNYIWRPTNIAHLCANNFWWYTMKLYWLFQYYCHLISYLLIYLLLIASYN